MAYTLETTEDYDFMLYAENGIPENDNYSDSDTIFSVSSRSVSLGSYIIVIGDNNAQVITFEMNKYQEGINLSDMNFEINYIRPNLSTGTVTKDNGLINFKISTDKIRFSWLIGSDVTLYTGELNFIIKVTDSNYQYKTLTNTLTILNTLVTETNSDIDTVELLLGNALYYGTDTPNSSARIWINDAVYLKGSDGEWVDISKATSDKIRVSVTNTIDDSLPASVEYTIEDGVTYLTFNIPKGYTPIKGVDYYTPEEEELINTAIDASNNAAILATSAAETATLAANNVDNTIVNAEAKIIDVETRFTTLTTEQQQDSEVIDARDGETSLKNRLDNINHKINTKAQFGDLETGLTGKIIQTINTAENGLVEIVKITGATTITLSDSETDITPDNAATFISAMNFDISSSNSDSSETDTLNVPYELKQLPNGTADTIELQSNGSLKHIQNIEEKIIDGSETNWYVYGTYDITLAFATNYALTDAKSISQDKILCDKFESKYGNTTDTEHIRNSNSQYPNALVIYMNKDRLDGYADSLTNEDKIVLLKTWLSTNSLTILYELDSPIEATLTVSPYLTSYANMTDMYTNSDPQVSLEVNLKSRLWAENYKLKQEIQSLKNAIITIGGSL